MNPSQRKPTPRQQAILDFIRQSTEERMFPPSIREIGEAVGLSSSGTVHVQLCTLERKGYLKRDPSKPRSIRLTDPKPLGTPRTPYVQALELVARLSKQHVAGELLDRQELDVALDHAEQARAEEVAA